MPLAETKTTFSNERLHSKGPQYFKCSYCLHQRTAAPLYSTNEKRPFCSLNCKDSYARENRRKSVVEMSPDAEKEVTLPSLDTEDVDLTSIYLRRHSLSGEGQEKVHVDPNDMLTLYKAIVDSPIGKALAAHIKSNNEHREQMSAMMATEMKKEKKKGVAVADSTLADLQTVNHRSRVNKRTSDVQALHQKRCASDDPTASRGYKSRAPGGIRVEDSGMKRTLVGLGQSQGSSSQYSPKIVNRRLSSTSNCDSTCSNSNFTTVDMYQL